MFNELEIWLIHPREEMCDAFRQRFCKLPNVIIKPLRFEQLPPHDCFVTAANSFGMMTAGIDAAVVARFGEKLMQTVQHRVMDQFLGEQPVGTAFLVATEDSEIPFVCHAPTMRVPGCIEGVTTFTWQRGQRFLPSIATIFSRNRKSER